MKAAFALMALLASPALGQGLPPALVTELEAGNNLLMAAAVPIHVTEPGFYLGGGVGGDLDTGIGLKAEFGFASEDGYVLSAGMLIDPDHGREAFAVGFTIPLGGF